MFTSEAWTFEGQNKVTCKTELVGYFAHMCWSGITW